MFEPKPKRFQILAISGGGYRGLYAAKVIADLERELQQPIARHFDMLAGTSIGGILALALALEIPAQRIVDLFVAEGERLFTRQRSLFGIFRSDYSAKPLQELLTRDDLFANRVLGACRHRVIIPTINYSTGKPQIFKTAHHPNFRRDHRLKLTDVALATSAAPTYFPRHVFENNQYVDGGLYANAPGLLALHEAETVLDARPDDVYLLAVGTMSSVFTVNPNRNREGGLIDWGGWWPPHAPKRLFGLSVSIQESLTSFMLAERLKGRYASIDDVLTPDRANAVALDRADPGAREVLLGTATERSKTSLGTASIMDFFKHQPSQPVFHYGEHATGDAHA